MGWSGVHKPKNISTVNFLKEEIRLDSKNYEIVDSAMCGYSKVIFAIRDKNKNYVFAMVFLIQFSNEEYNFRYKSMDEFCGPVVTCPKKILKLLTPIEEIAKIETDWSAQCLEWASNWRKRSEEEFNKPPVKDGDIIEMEEPLTFKGGYEYKHFKKVDRRFYAIQINSPSYLFGRVRMNLKKYKFKVLSETEIADFQTNYVKELSEKMK